MNLVDALCGQCNKPFRWDSSLPRLCSPCKEVWWAEVARLYQASGNAPEPVS